MFNPDMVHDGCAFEYTYDKPYRYQAQFCAAEADARTSERGLWFTVLRYGGQAQAQLSRS
ncbi:MAG: thermonuclease family protein [Mycobacterium sp.]|uniref:thermonuclease family protein n=1 Tax=Williamsia sp. TaxID=1872085 RepID=UPI002F93FB20